tara:strand:- start:10 stop:363 length:354 start_codon:yes stop_codon:yes gene_type:complete
MLEIFELKIIKDKIIIKEGANEGIKDALITVEVVRAIFIEVLNIETLKIDNIIIIIQLLIKISYIILILLIMNGNNITITIRFRKKLSLMGSKEILLAIFAAITFPPQRAVANIKKK